MRATLGNVVQITNPEHKWFPCFLIVTKEKDWGCVADIMFPASPDGPVVKAGINLKEDDYDVVGPSLVLEKETLNEDVDSDSGGV